MQPISSVRWFLLRLLLLLQQELELQQPRTRVLRLLRLVALLLLLVRHHAPVPDTLLGTLLRIPDHHRDNLQAVRQHRAHPQRPTVLQLQVRVLVRRHPGLGLSHRHHVMQQAQYS